VNEDGYEAGINVPSGGTGIVISAGASDAVSLRGLTIDGGGVGTTGIQFNTGASLTIENCVIRHVAFNGFNFWPNATSFLNISNSQMSDNGNAGIAVVPTGSGTVTAVFNRVDTNNNSYAGIAVDGTTSTGTLGITVSDGIASGNEIGFLVYSGTGSALTTLTVVRSVAANNAAGLYASGSGAILRAAQTTVTGNFSHGWGIVSGGIIGSYGDNYIDGNGGNTGSLTTIAKQ
jgi:Right handed beta helix region